MDIDTLLNALKNIDNSKITILIVVASNTNRYHLSKLLDRYNVIEAVSGVNAIKTVKKEHIDLVLLDIFMPEIDGYKVLKQLKNNKKSKNIPVIFLTSTAYEESIDMAYKAGVMDYIIKPFIPKELLARIYTQLSISFMQKDLEKRIELVNKHVSFSTTDLNGVITEVSEAFCRLSGYTKKELIGKKHNIMRHEDTADDVYNNLWDTLLKGKNWEGEVKNKRKNGGYFWTYVVISPIYDATDTIYGYTAIRQDITNEKIVQGMAITDQLTDIYNRRYFNEVFPREIKRSIRTGYSLSFMMLDIDYFKQYNDTYGHQAGDEVLKKVAKTLKSQLLRIEDLVFRIGGEEFGVIYTTNVFADSSKIANNLCKAIVDLKIEHKTSKVVPVLSVSIGLVCIKFSLPANITLDMNDIYKLADEELYRAKDSGRNKVCYKYLNA